jgi:GR25 family glycosyltransferase involved in LPS biosynthesis
MDRLLTKFCGGKPWKAYCISLPRCDERRKRFSAWASENRLTFQYWDAFDKKNLTDEICTQRQVNVAGQPSKGALACRISYEQLWNSILEKDAGIPNIFILEDDAGFLKKNLADFETFLNRLASTNESWMAVQFGFGTMTGTQLSLLKPGVSQNIFRVDFSDQTHAILYKRSAIRELKALSENPRYRTRPADGLVLAMIQQRKGAIYAPSESILEQVDPISYISTDA